MTRVLLAIAALAAAVLAVTLNTRDPGDAFAIPTVVLAATVAAGALAAAAGMRLGTEGSRRRGVPARTRRTSLRRGAEIGGALGLLAFLRLADGLTPLTGSLVVLAFVAAEAVVSARGA